LDPKKDKLVCVPRSENVNQVIEGINNGDYWSILGSRPIGKTTFLRQIQNEFMNAHHVYINFDIIPSTKEKKFYQWLRNQILSEVPSEQKNFDDDWKNERPEFNFFRFLEKFKAKDDTKKIVFLFDEIDNLPFLRTFLHIWRKVFHERSDKVELNRYAVIITGSVDLITQTIGPNSPFNIAETFYIKDFSTGESLKFIDESFEELKIEIEPKAKEKLISQISGHPQMLQQACHILFNKANASNNPIIEKDVDDAIEDLLMTNASLDTLKQDIKMNDILENLIRDILKGKKIKYHPNKKFSVLGAGAIIEKNSFCKIRNELYRRVIRDVFRINEEEHSAEKKPTKPLQPQVKRPPERMKITFTIISLVLAVITAFFATQVKSTIGIKVSALFTFIALLFWILKR
jgi:hypothetical protein